MLISTALLLDSIIRNSVCTPAKLPCRRVEVGYENIKNPTLYSKRNKDDFKMFGIFCFGQVPRVVFFLSFATFILIVLLIFEKCK
jgi:hypothetical protein